MPALDDKLQFLKTPETYGTSVRRIDCIETHMSWVFLVGKNVFKLKKPVRFAFLDFSNLKAREFYCREEVRLNARLAPGIYRGLLALQWCDGRFRLLPENQLPAPGETVDWLVWMRRLPLRRMLHRLIANQLIDLKDLNALVDVLAHFYRTTPAAQLSENIYLARFQCEQNLNREVLLRSQFKLKAAPLAIERLGEALDLCTDVLRERVACERVREGHGDLRPEHICLLHPPLVIDCLEFSTLLRQVDPLDEIAFLGLECELMGAPWIGPYLIAGMTNALKDYPNPALLNFYIAHRALLRARLAMAHLLDPKPSTPTRWPALANQYIARSLVASDEFISAMHHERHESPLQTEALPTPV